MRLQIYKNYIKPERGEEKYVRVVCWSSGLLVYRSAGLQVYWSAGLEAEVISFTNVNLL